MWRHIASNAVTFLVVGLFVVGGVIIWGRGQYSAAGPLAEAICLQVASGSNMGRVSRRLEEQGAISSGTIFRLGAEYEEKAENLKAGSFLINPGASMAEIVDRITGDGRSTCGTQVLYLVRVNDLLVRVRELDEETQEFEVTAEHDPKAADAPEEYAAAVKDVATEFTISVAEGVTSWQVVEGLRAIDILNGDIADVPPEGALAPDNYEVRPGDDRAAILEQMLDAQVARVSAAWAGRNPEVPLDSPEELLTLASIVEKETGVPEERGTVASVFVNRLRQGMRLQTDPTVIYGVTRGQGVLGRGLRQSELRAETPWNTYVIDGLPPTPIANPGRASLEAAANPPESPYVFFVADGTGGHAFSETLEEHNANVARWREIEAARQNSNN